MAGGGNLPGLLAPRVRPLEKDDQRDCWPQWWNASRRAREWPVAFFHMNNTYLFVGDYKYWLMVDYNEVDAYGAEGDYVLNRARLYRDRRDFVIQTGDTGRPADYPVSPPGQS